MPIKPRPRPRLNGNSQRLPKIYDQVADPQQLLEKLTSNIVATPVIQAGAQHFEEIGQIGDPRIVLPEQQQFGTILP